MGSVAIPVVAASDGKCDSVMTPCGCGRTTSALPCPAPYASNGDRQLPTRQLTQLHPFEMPAAMERRRGRRQQRRLRSGRGRGEKRRCGAGWEGSRRVKEHRRSPHLGQRRRQQRLVLHPLALRCRGDGALRVGREETCDLLHAGVRDGDSGDRRPRRPRIPIAAAAVQGHGHGRALHHCRGGHLALAVSPRDGHSGGGRGRACVGVGRQAGGASESIRRHLDVLALQSNGHGVDGRTERLNRWG